MIKSVLSVTLIMILLITMLSGCNRPPDSATVAVQGGIASNNALELSGSIEAREITIASEIGGRVMELAVEEGESVTPDDLLVRLDDALIREQRTQAAAAADEARAALSGAEAELALTLAGARGEEIDAAHSSVRAARANVALARSLQRVAEARVEGAHAQVSAAQGQLAAAQAGVSASQADLSQAEAGQVKGESGPTPEEIAIAERQLERAKNELWSQQSLRDSVCGWPDEIREISCDVAQARVQAAEEVVNIAELELWRVREGLRDEDLDALASQTEAAQAGVQGAYAHVSSARAQVDAAQAAAATAAADVETAEARVQAAEGELDRAEANLALILAGARSEELDLLRAGVQRAEAALAGAEANLRASDVRIEQLTLRSPIRGEVLQVMVNQGELARAGSPLLVLGDLLEVTLTVYVPQSDLGRVALGQQVDVAVDAYEQTFSGRVTHIGSRAEFTPTHVDTQEERVKMVFAVKITLDNPDMLLKPGMPADATFR